MALGKQIFPLRIAECELRSVLLDRQVIDLTEDVEQGYQRLWRGLEHAGLDPKDVFQWDGRRAPYPGLLAFQESDAALYFGRDELILETIDVLNRARRFGGANLIVCVGASGSGKSSLVRAGVLPRLRRDAQSWLAIDPIRPMREPLLELAAALADAYAAVGESVSAASLRSRLADPERAGALIEIAGELKRAARNPTASVLLTLDQLEEALDSAPADDMRALLVQLAAALADRDSPLMVLATLRSDFLHALQNDALLGRLGVEIVSIPPLELDQFAQIVEGPAKVAGIELESGLVA